MGRKESGLIELISLCTEPHHQQESSLVSNAHSPVLLFSLSLAGFGWTTYAADLIQIEWIINSNKQFSLP